MNKFVYNGRNGRDGEEKQKPIGVILVIAIMLLGSIGIAALPLLFFAGVGYIIYMANKAKSGEEGGSNVSETFKTKMEQFQQKLDSMDEAGTHPTVKNVFGDFIGKADKTGADASKSARAHMDSKFKDARRRQSGSKDGETFYSMLSRSEQTHYDSFSSDSHDEYTHRSNELKDLLNAGIIEMPEYKDRMALLKQEFKR